MSDATTHALRVERRGPKRFVVVCTCGHEGMNSKGTEFYGRGPALAGAFAHQREVGLPMEIPAYVDLDPWSKRG
jgi:hypothetical protein